MPQMRFLAAGLALAASLASATSPTYTAIFSSPLPIAPIATPYTTATVDGQQIDFYEITIEAFEKQVFEGLGSASFVGYNGVAPGPTFYVQRGVETVIRFNNNNTNDHVVHLHGSPTHSPWDGWAEDYIQDNQFKDYYYPNNETARSLWYHDHADGITSGNCFEGLTAAYIIYDPAEDSLNLPTGKYDVPLQISDKMYDSSGALVSVDDEQYNFFGDIIEVNYQPWPYLQVEPRKYRLRLYNQAMSRPFDLHVEQSNGDWLDFQVIASDSGLFGSPVESNDVVIAMGERYEIVIDFSEFAGQNLTMKNTFSMDGIPTYANTDLVMSFVVGNNVEDWSSNDVPSTLNPSIAWPAAKTEVDHTFRFQFGGDNHWTINGVDFSDVNNRVLAKPPQGTVELWELQYASAGNDFHPIHIHLVDFQILSRTGGSRGVLPYESAGLKDIVLLEPGETVQVLAYYGDWAGVYMFHCHNLIHEDHMMMAAMNVTALEGLGYENVEDLSNPTDSRFSAQWWSADAYEDSSIQSTLSYLGGLGAYNEQTALEGALSAYYSTNTAAASETSTVPASTSASATPTEIYGPPNSQEASWMEHGSMPSQTSGPWGQNWASAQGHPWRRA